MTCNWQTAAVQDVKKTVQKRRNGRGVMRIASVSTRSLDVTCAYKRTVSSRAAYQTSNVEASHLMAEVDTCDKLMK